MFDSEASGKRTSRMWLKMAGIYERAAYETAKTGDPHKAAILAELADASFWQATGEGDFNGLNRLLHGPAQ